MTLQSHTHIWCPWEHIIVVHQLLPNHLYNVSQQMDSQEGCLDKLGKTLLDFSLDQWNPSTWLNKESVTYQMSSNNLY